MVLAVQSQRDSAGLPPAPTLAHANGDVLFGFALERVACLIEGLPDADKCAQYVFRARRKGYKAARKPLSIDKQGRGAAPATPLAAGRGGGGAGGGALGGGGAGSAAPPKKRIRARANGGGAWTWPEEGPFVIRAQASSADPPRWTRTGHSLDTHWTLAGNLPDTERKLT